MGKKNNKRSKKQRKKNKSIKDRKKASESMKEVGIANLAGGVTGDIKGLDAAFRRNSSVPANREDLEVQYPNVDPYGHEPAYPVTELKGKESSPGGSTIRIIKAKKGRQEPLNMKSGGLAKRGYGKARR